MTDNPIDELTEEQVEQLLCLLEKVENAKSAVDAVWLDRDGRAELREIKETIEENHK